MSAETQNPARQHAAGATMVLAATLLFSLGGLAVRLVEADDGWAIVAYRSGGACLAIFLYVLATQGLRAPSAFRAVGGIGLIGAAGLAAAFSGYVQALQYTTVAGTLIVLAAGPVVAAGFARLWLAERIEPATAAAVAAAIFGVAVMSVDGLRDGAWLGIAFALAATIGSSIYLTVVRRQRHMDMTPSFCVGAGMASLLAFTLAGDLQIGARDTLLCLAMGAIQVGFAALLYVRGARLVPAVEVALIALLEIVFGTLWVWLALGETPTTATFIGGAVVLAAVIGQTLAQARSGQ